jgi:hypothetical protein
MKISGFGRCVLGNCAAVALLAGCGAFPPSGVPGATAAATSPMIRWVPSSLTLDINGSVSAKIKRATLEFSSHHGGVDYQLNCPPYFSIGSGGKRPLIADRTNAIGKPFLKIGGGQQITSTLTVTIDP